MDGKNYGKNNNKYSKNSNGIIGLYGGIEPLKGLWLKDWLNLIFFVVFLLALKYKIIDTSLITVVLLFCFLQFLINYDKKKIKILYDKYRNAKFKYLLIVHLLKIFDPNYFESSAKSSPYKNILYDLDYLFTFIAKYNYHDILCEIQSLINYLLIKRSNGIEDLNELINEFKKNVINNVNLGLEEAERHVCHLIKTKLPSRVDNSG